MRPDAVHADYCTRFGQSHIVSTGNADVQLRHGSADAGAWKPCIGAWEKIHEACHADRCDTGCGARTCNAFTGSGAGGYQLDRISQVSDGAKELDTAVIAQSGNIQYVESNPGFGTYPEITVYTGIPVKWTINVPEDVINGCNYKMIVKTYGITLNLHRVQKIKVQVLKIRRLKVQLRQKAAAASYITPAVENGQLAIDIGTLTEHPLYVNYDSNGTNIQMIAVNASGRLSTITLNTCQTMQSFSKSVFQEEKRQISMSELRKCI